MLANLLRRGGGPVVVASDDFNRADGALGSTSVGSLPWRVDKGTITISGNKPVGSGTTPQIATVDASTGDQIRVTGTLGLNDALVLRLADSSNYLRVRRHYNPSSVSTVCTPGAWSLYTSTGTSCNPKTSIDPGTYESSVSNCDTTQTKQIVSSTSCTPSGGAANSGWSTSNWQRTRTVTTSQVTSPATYYVYVEYLSGGTIHNVATFTDVSTATEIVSAALSGNTLTISGDFGSQDVDITAAAALASNTRVGFALTTGGSGSPSFDDFKLERL